MPVAPETTENPFTTKSWTKSVNDLLDKEEPKKEEPSGKVTAENRPAEDQPPIKPPVPDDGKGGQPSATTGNKPDGGTKVDGAKSPDTKGEVRPDGKTDGGEDWEKAPRPKGINEADFQAWKLGRKKSEVAFKAEIAKQTEQIQSLQNQVKEEQGKVPQQMPETAKAEIERLTRTNQELSDRIRVLDVTQHPKFQSYFQGKVDTTIAKAKKLVGTERAEAIEKIIKSPESDYKLNQLEEFMGDIESNITKTRLAVVLEELENINTEKESEIANANANKDKLHAESTAKAKANEDFSKKLFDDTLSMMQGEKGFPPFQLKADDQAWNEAVSQRVELAKAFMTGNNVKPEVLAKAAFMAAATPLIIQAHQADAAAWKQEKEQLEAKITELVAAQPKPGAGSADSNGTQTGTRIKPGTSPTEAMKSWTSDIREKLGA